MWILYALAIIVALALHPAAIPAALVGIVGWFVVKKVIWG